MLPKECACVVLIALVLCGGFTQVHGGKIVFPESVSPRETPSEVSEVNGDNPESRGLWESDLFFLQKLSGLFGGSEGDQRQKPSRQGGLRPEPLPPQLLFPPNRRVGAGNHRPQPHNRPAGSNNPQRNVPAFRLPLGSGQGGNPPRRLTSQALNPPQQNLSPPPPQDSLSLPSQNFIAIHIPPPPPPPPSPPSSLANISPIEPASNFPYEFVRPSGITPSAVSHTRPPVKAPNRVDALPQAQSTKPVPTKPIKSKKPTLFGSLPDLVGAFSMSQKPQVSLPTRPRPQHQQHLQGSSFVLKPQQLPPKPIPQAHRPHPRPAPQPQKQHPRPPPQPQRVIMQPQKPTTIQKKPIYPDFKPSPQEGSILADAFQPVFVASPSMDELDNDIMKPMHVASARSSGITTTTTPSQPVFQDFF